MTRTTVYHYGIHTAPGGINFLEQSLEKSGSNAVGLREKSPFKVKPGKSKFCNHLIPLTVPSPQDVHIEFFERLKDDPLVQAMLPVPKQRTNSWFIDDSNENILLYIICLSRMSSPVNPTVYPIWQLTLNQIIEELQTTNVQPLVLTDINSEHTDLIQKLAKSAPIQPRKLVLVGDKFTVVSPLTILNGWTIFSSLLGILASSRLPLSLNSTCTASTTSLT